MYLCILQGPNRHTLMQLKDAVRDGLRAVKNAIDDRAIIPGAGAFEVAVNQTLQQYKEKVKGKQRLGVQAYAEALLVIPKTLGKYNIADSVTIIIVIIVSLTFFMLLIFSH